MKIWLLSHPFGRRDWCHVRWRAPHSESWYEGFVWMEWNNAPAESRDGYLIPGVPTDNTSHISNVDPLVLGPYMYFDYCKKEAIKAPNGLAAGDVILGVSVLRRKRTVVVDTVFVIGATCPWPARSGGVPNWPDPGPLAERVHFHPYAREVEHPRMHVLPDVSYRSRRDDEVEGLVGFSWIPCAKAVPSEPFTLDLRGKTHHLLQQAYGETPIENCGQGFRVVTQPHGSIAELLEALRVEAAQQDFQMAAELAPLSAARVRTSAVPLSRACGSQPRAFGGPSGR